MRQRFRWRAPSPARRPLWAACVSLVVCESLVAALAPASAESIPDGLRSCAATPDPAQRLACYDREMARYAERPAGAPPAAAIEAVPKHLTARVVSVENRSDHLIVHLDNGQVWEQVQETTASMDLRAGYKVTIDRGLMGYYWLAGPSQVSMKVRQQL